MIGRFVIALLAIVCVNVTHSQDKPRELKLSTAVGPAYPLGRAGERWAQLLNEGAAGAFDARHYPGAVLALRDPLREFGALRDGDADLAVGSGLAWSAQLPAFAVYGLPWIAAEREQQEALADDGRVRDGVSAQAARAGVIVIAIVPLGERVIATTKAAVVTPAQLSGLRIRTLPIPLVIETFATLGARAEAMSLTDAQAAFAAGTLDGQEATATTLAATRIAASGQKYVTRWDAFGDVLVFAVRKSIWDRWSEAQRAAARESALAAAREAAPLAREDAALVGLTKQGVTLVRPTAAQRAAFRGAVEAVWTKWTNAIGPDIVAAAVAATQR